MLSGEWAGPRRLYPWSHGRLQLLRGRLEQRPGVLRRDGEGAAWRFHRRVTAEARREERRAVRREVQNASAQGMERGWARRSACSLAGLLCSGDASGEHAVDGGALHGGSWGSASFIFSTLVFRELFFDE